LELIAILVRWRRRYQQAFYPKTNKHLARTWGSALDSLIDVALTAGIVLPDCRQGASVISASTPINSSEHRGADDFSELTEQGPFGYIYAVRLPYGRIVIWRERCVTPNSTPAIHGYDSRGGVNPTGDQSPRVLRLDTGGAPKAGRGSRGTTAPTMVDAIRRSERPTTSPDGQHILSFAQAQEAARAWFADLACRDRGEAMVGSFTVRECADEYKGAKIEPEISFHVLCHAWASLAVMAGVPLLVVARHADTRMVEKHYGHLASSYIVDAIRASGPRFGIETDAALPVGVEG
jgi:hypothetical protein